MEQWGMVGGGRNAPPALLPVRPPPCLRRSTPPPAVTATPAEPLLLRPRASATACAPRTTPAPPPPRAASPLSGSLREARRACAGRCRRHAARRSSHPRTPTVVFCRRPGLRRLDVSTAAAIARMPRCQAAAALTTLLPWWPVATYPSWSLSRVQVRTGPVHPTDRSVAAVESGTSLALPLRPCSICSRRGRS